MMYLVITHFISAYKAPDVMCIFQNLTITFAFWLLNRKDDSAGARLMVLALSPCLFHVGFFSICYGLSLEVSE